MDKQQKNTAVGCLGCGGVVLVLGLAFALFTEDPNADGKQDQRLAVAADIRDEFRDSDGDRIAYVVASGRTLKITYTVARSEYVDAASFLTTIGHANLGIEQIAQAGFETLEITADDFDGRSQTKTYDVKELAGISSSPNED